MRRIPRRAAAQYLQRVEMPLSATRTTLAGMRPDQLERSFQAHIKCFQVAVVHANGVRAGPAQRIQHAVKFVSRVHLDQHVELKVVRRLQQSGFSSASVSAAAISRIASARCARASTIWYSSTIKSLRRHGSGTAAEASSRLRRLP